MENTQKKPPPLNDVTENKGSGPTFSGPKQIFKGSKQMMVNLFAGAVLVLIFEWASTIDIQVNSMFWPMVIIEAGLFIPLGFWAKQKPYTATLAGLAVIIIFSILFFALMGSEYLFNSGLIVRLLTIFSIGGYLPAAKKLESVKQRGK